MRRGLLALWLLLAATPAAAAERFISPTGTGATCSEAVPCSTQTAATASVAGDIITALDGTYTGDAYVLLPGIWVPGRSGTSAAPITVRAKHDGAVTFDGEHVRRAVELTGNSWWVLEGFNAKRGSRSTVSADNLTNLTVRRVVIWDGNMARNSNTVSMVHVADSLWEDVAVFGTGRKNLNPFGAGSTRTVFRRVWTRWEGSITQGPKFGISVEYGSSATTLENVLVTWSGESMPHTYKLTDSDGNILQPEQTFTNFDVQNLGTLIGKDSTQDVCANHNIRGTIIYLKATDRRANSGTVRLGQGLQSCVQFRHSLLVIDPGIPNFSGIAGFAHGSSGTNLTHDHVTSIAASNNFGGFVRTNELNLTTRGSHNPFTNTGAGANLCFRWVNGSVTTTPLWPWPMNDRIKAATAAAGRYTGPCPFCKASNGSGFTFPLRTETDVTAEIESILGPIPSECRSDIVTPPPTVAAPTVQYTVDEAASGTCSSLADSGSGTALNLACSSVMP